MSRRSRRHRKRFGCGHRGFGAYCHCCAEAKARKEVTVLARREKRLEWLRSFEGDGVELRHLPRKVVEKARQVIADLGNGVSLAVLRGKRLRGDRTLVRVPVGYRYRLLCRWGDDGIVPLRVMSHEAYNRVARHPM